MCVALERESLFVLIYACDVTCPEVLPVSSMPGMPLSTHTGFCGKRSEADLSPSTEQGSLKM